MLRFFPALVCDVQKVYLAVLSFPQPPLYDTLKRGQI